MYGSMTETAKLVGGMDSAIEMENTKISLDDPFSEKPYAKEFWKKVTSDSINNARKWSESMMKIRIDTMLEKCKEIDIIEFFFETFDGFKDTATSEGKEYLMPSFIQELEKLCIYVLNKFAEEEGRESRYAEMIKDETETVLHLAAGKNLYGIAKRILELYPKHCYLTSDAGKLPVELAISGCCDETAALLIKSMKRKDTIRKLFECDGGPKSSSKLNFRDLCTNENMQKTTEAVLDCLYESSFQYSPVPDIKKAQEMWSELGEEPMSYNFYYRILDGDINGRAAKIEETKGSNNFILNPNFDKKSYSGLYYIASSPFNKDIISHPVIRHLIQRKWSSYGDAMYKKCFLIYLLYIVVMSLAFFLGLGNTDTNTYKTLEDMFRGIFEAMTLLFAIILLLNEIEQMTKLRKEYLKEGFNYLNVTGLLLIICWYLCKWLETFSSSAVTVQWSLASVAYLTSVLCVFKYFSAYKVLGVYIRTFIRIIQFEISMFMLVFVIVMAAFTGSVILAIRATNGFTKAKMNGVEVLFQEVRALFEGEAFANNYIGFFSVGVIILLMLNMLTVIIVMANVLIGQINNTYNTAAENANVQFDVDILRIITKIDIGSFIASNKRIKYYEDTVYVADAATVQGIFKEWKTQAAAKQA